MDSNVMDLCEFKSVTSLSINSFKIFNIFEPESLNKITQTINAKQVKNNENVLENLDSNLSKLIKPQSLVTRESLNAS